MAAKKLGRPTNDPKKHQLRLRMSDGEIEKLDFCSQSLGISKTDVVRLGIDRVYQEIKK